MMKKHLLPCLLACLLLLSCAGCGSAAAGDTEAVNIVFLLSIADDEARFSTAMRELASLPAKPGTDYAFLSMEGTPACIGEPGKIPDLTDRGYSRAMMKRVEASIRADLAGRLTGYAPASPEVDIAAATDCAVRFLQASAVPGRKNILVYCAGGKSTTGLINLAQTPICRLDIDASVPVIASQMADMSVVDEVIWYYCGDYIGEDQPPLSKREQERMKTFYDRLFRTLGAKQVTFRAEVPSDGYYIFQTPVSLMAVEGTGSGLRELRAADLTREDAFAAPMQLSETQVRYQPDSDEFLDPAQAEAAIRPVADYLLAHPEVELLLYGTAAGDVDTETTLRLSLARAQRVKNTICAAGVADGRLRVISVRIADDPYYQYGLGLGPEASVCRKTVLADLSSDFAREMLTKAL